MRLSISPFENSRIGFQTSKAVDLDMLIFAAIEGGVLLNRPYYTGDPLRKISTNLQKMINSSKE